MKTLKILGNCLGALFLFVGFLCLFSAGWYITTFGNLGFEAIISTLLSSMGGLETSLVIGYVINAVIPTLLFTLLFMFIFFGKTKRSIVIKIGEKIKATLYPIKKKYVSVICSFVLCAALVLGVANTTGFFDYLENSMVYSTIYEEYYVKPDQSNIAFPKEKRNLIYIYLESMETAFFSKELGGANENLIIPELYDLANNNINFSNNSSVGGFYSVGGVSNTISSLVAQNAGVPLKSPINEKTNEYGSKHDFLPGLTTLSDILNKNGYYQTFMLGSDANFAGQKGLYLGHGANKIYDINSAKKDKLVPDDYHVWWGMEDKYVYSYAKQELPKIAKMNKPFAFTMMTIDTHHVDGYFCDLCENKYSENYENVYACASRQINDFIKWLEKQDFYENTTVIICGDHPSMDSQYFEKNMKQGYSRKVYNCFINSAITPQKAKNRISTTVDLFPTTLAAMGCTIKGDRLGLGTNLFSDTPTLAEQLGLKKFGEEMMKNSKYYLKNFFVSGK